MIAIMAVGPIVISLQLPRKIYTKQLINDVYRPYCGFRPAISAYAIDCGIKVNATVKPANVSWRKVENLY
jgi:putative component of membrane protein insertase Oxa1/YidC/SpoIIIJ protein YidD